MKNWSICEDRELKQYSETKTIQEGSSTTKKKEELLYKYYMCDVCYLPVIVKKYDGYAINGGIINYRKPSGNKFQVVLHNKCLKKALEDLQKYYENTEEKQDAK